MAVVPQSMGSLLCGPMEAGGGTGLQPSSQIILDVVAEGTDDQRSAERKQCVVRG